MEQWKTWDELKLSGSQHYKTGFIEPIDLYRSLGVFRGYALTSIVKYAVRNIRKEPIATKDMEKIIHLAQLLVASCGDIELKKEIKKEDSNESSGQAGTDKRYHEQDSRF